MPEKQKQVNIRKQNMLLSVIFYELKTNSIRTTHHCCTKDEKKKRNLTCLFYIYLDEGKGRGGMSLLILSQYRSRKERRWEKVLSSRSTQQGLCQATTCLESNKRAAWITSSLFHECSADTLNKIIITKRTPVFLILIASFSPSPVNLSTNQTMNN